MGIPSRFAGLPGDILSIDDYITNREGRTVGEIVRQVEIMEEAARPTQRPVWIFISGNNLHNHYREPTPGEQVAQSYGWPWPALGPALLPGQPGGQRALDHAAPAQPRIAHARPGPLLHGARAPGDMLVGRDPLCRAAGRAQVYLLAVNQENRPAGVNFQVAGLDQADAVVLFEDRTVAVKSGWATTKTRASPWAWIRRSPRCSP